MDADTAERPRHQSHRAIAVVVALSVWMAVPATAAGQAEAREAERLLQQARQAAAQGRPERAIALAGQALDQDADLAAAYYLRGRERFRLARIDESVEDFDAYVRLRPQLASRQWERGIALFYAERYDHGAAQFEFYQTYHDNDVENSTWRFLCMVPVAGVDEARQALLPIRDDPRVPMMEIYRLYQGQAQVQDVLEAVGEGSPDEAERRGRSFYAHLYIGLYLEATSQAEDAARHLRRAAELADDNPRINGYMGDVARVHVRLRLPDDAPPP